MSLTIVPITFRQACAFITAHHRHHRPPRGIKFALGVADDSGELVGVATVGRPVARHLDDGWTVEVTRTCTRGVRNANSMLYGSAWRVARAMGYHRLITYTQRGETGASLRAAGLCAVAALTARPGWHTPSRPRAASGVENIPRTRWEIQRKPHPGTASLGLAGAATRTGETSPGNTCTPAISGGTAGHTRHHIGPAATITPLRSGWLHDRRSGIHPSARPSSGACTTGIQQRANGQGDAA